MSKSLNGLCILNTRPKDEAATLTHNIQQAGGISIEMPAIQIEPLVFTMPYKLTAIDHAIFISPHAVSYFFQSFPKQDWPKSLIPFALGKGTQNKLSIFGLTTQALPSNANSENFLSLTQLQRIKNKKVLLIKGIGGRTLIEETLLKRGAKVIPLHVYQRISPKPDHLMINSMWQENKVDIILMTSYEAMVNILTLFTGSAHTWLIGKPWIVISERLASLAKQQGVNTVIISRVDAIIETLMDSKEIMICKRMQATQPKHRKTKN